MSKKYKVFWANPYPLGVRREGKDIYASMVSVEKDCGILLYNSKNAGEDDKKILKLPFPENQHIGQVYSMKIEDIPAFYDGYRLYQGSKIVPDEFGICYKSFPYGTPLGAEEMMGVFGDKAFDWEDEKKPELKFSESVFYGLHVRGFTMNAGGKCRNKGTFAGVKEKLDYLQELGVTSIILMPAYEFIENELTAANKNVEISNGLNYWGYKKAYYYAPKASYADGKDPCIEFKKLVKACHTKGMELFMQFYFPEEVSVYEAVHILEYWVMEYHVDGFQIVAGQDKVEAAVKSPLLAQTKLIAGEGHGDGPRFCRFGSEAMYNYRRFIKGDNYMVPAVLDTLGQRQRDKKYMNSIADYNSFRLADMVSYNDKHNAANGENNADGADDNGSWNCGVEGPTEDPRILTLRLQQMKNALSLLFLGQGTPYLFMGDEMGSTQYGNNNPYNQDNVISWLDWDCLTQNKELYDFAKALIAYRKENPFLHAEIYLDGRDYLGYGYPNISFHGNEAYKVENGEDCREFGIMLCGEAANKGCKLIYIACNMHWLSRKLALPRLKAGAEWQIALKTSQASDIFIEESHIDVPSRTIIVLEAFLQKPDERKEKHITPF